jgi:hypothetical protein
MNVSTTEKKVRKRVGGWKARPINLEPIWPMEVTALGYRGAAAAANQYRSSLH